MGKRVVVNASTRASDALERRVEAEERNITEVVNRSLVLYDWLMHHISEGGTIILGKDGKDEEIRIL